MRWFCPRTNMIQVHCYCFVAALVLWAAATSAAVQGYNRNEAEARDFMRRYEVTAPRMLTAQVMAEWKYNTNITDENERNNVAKQVELAAFNKEAALNASSFAWSTFKDEDLQRKFKLISKAGTSILPAYRFEELSNIIANMTSIYSKAKICSYATHKDPNCQKTWSLDPEITKVLAESQDYDELLYAWQQWHETSARPMRASYSRYVELDNEAAKMNGYNDMSEEWLGEYESDTFAKEVEDLWQTVRPFYLQLHAYVRRKLIGKYGSKVRHDGPIPAHLLGNMWSQSWETIESLVKPFPNKSSADATPEMKRQNYNASKMFEVANEFYESVNLIGVPSLFWRNSMIERPQGREVVCHASAWDFYDGRDFRIKMCTEVNTVDFITIHHELGHIQYYMQYKDQPVMYKTGANPGFHEAVGDTIALSASTASHLQKIGLLPTYSDDAEGNLNSLMSMALQKVAFLPFGYTMDQWRWKVFKGEITPDNYNAKWWELKKQYQGVEPAVTRSEIDFDPGAKYHIAADVEYLRYFVSFIIQFQFHRALCQEAGQYVKGDPARPLHKCDIYQNAAAGALFSKMLRMGASKPWPEAMEVITKNQTRQMDASALVEYFQPLMDFLISENKKNQEYIGWRDISNDTTPNSNSSSTPTANSTTTPSIANNGTTTSNSDLSSTPIINGTTTSPHIENNDTTTSRSDSPTTPIIHITTTSSHSPSSAAVLTSSLVVVCATIMACFV